MVRGTFREYDQSVLNSVIPIDLPDEEHVLLDEL
jgi:hypothetical protein